MLSEIARKTRARTGTTHLSAEDYLDNGAKITLKVDIDEQEASITLSFNLSVPNILLLLIIIVCFFMIAIINNVYCILNKKL